MAQKPEGLATPPTRPSLSIDWELYADYLDGSDLSDDEKREFIQAIWYIMVSFVDLGFDVKSPDHDDVNASPKGSADQTTPPTKTNTNAPAKEETNAIR